MKKLFYLLFALPLFLASCHDDNKLPEVSLDVQMTGQTEITDKGVVVVPQGTVFSVSSITIASSSAEQTALGGASYWLDYVFLGSTIVEPFKIDIDTSTLPVGNHLLQIEVPVLAVDYSPATAYLAYKLQIVEPQTEPTPDPDQPATPETHRVTPQLKVK